MHVVITRPKSDCADLKARLEAIGCTVTTAPLLDIVFEPIPSAALANATGLIATSRNGLRALAQSQTLASALALPVYVVGPATEKLAREFGFKTVIAGAGTAASLVPLITASDAITRAHLVHLAGDHLAFSLEAALAPLAVELTRLKAYKSVAAKTLSTAVVDGLCAGTFDAVVLMSPRSARTWVSLIEALPLKTNLTNVTHICLSSAITQCITDGLKSLRPVKALTASRPTSEEIVALVYRLAADRKTE